ncbi:DUF3297 family protein [Polymorphobacter sp. PAMC 29334]|uniref:DUF3297 family protein n=1 Tax=Polymorphobacter sp. PAMC 29334 TaxID=2862331 RepID=UPI00351D5A18
MTDETIETTTGTETPNAASAKPDAATPEAAIVDTPPDRLSNNPNSPHYEPAMLERGIGIRFKGVERTNVDEYCVSEGWVRLTVAGSKDRYGNPITIKQQGEVVPYFRS